MNLHRLRVVNFDRRTSEENASRRILDEGKHIKNNLNDNKPRNSHRVIRTLGERGDGVDSSKKQNTVFNQTLKSSIPFKRNKTTKYLRRNTSLVVLKRKKIFKNKKSHSIVFPYNIDGFYKGSFVRVKRKKYTEKEQHEDHGADSGLKVLFTNETFRTSNKASRKCDTKSGTSRKRSKSLYNAQKNNPLLTPQHNYVMNCNNHLGQRNNISCIISKKSFIGCRKLRRSKDGKSHSLRNIRSANSNRFHVPTHYGLNELDTGKRKQNKRISPKIHRDEISQNHQFQSNDKKLLIPSCLKTSVKCLTESAVSTSQNFHDKSTSKTKNSYRETLKCNSKKNKKIGSKATNYCIDSRTKQSKFTTLLLKKCLFYGESVMKYILFGLICAAWLPCIIVMLACWTLAYPLRPHFTISDNLPSTKELRKKVTKESTCDFWRRYINYMFHFITGILHKACNCSKQRVIVSLLKNKKYVNRTLRQETHHRSTYNFYNKRKHPNPKRKYTLFYTENRGWMIKPIPSELIDKSTHIAQTLKRLFHHDFTKKRKIHVPTDNIENTLHSHKNENHSSSPNFVRENQHLPFNPINKGLENHYRFYNNHSLSYHHSIKPHSPLEKQMINNFYPLQKTYKRGHEHALTINKPHPNYIQQIDRLSYGDIKTKKDHSIETQKFQTLFHASKMRKSLPSSKTPEKYIYSPRRNLRDDEYYSGLSNRHMSNSIPTKFISNSKSSPNNNVEPRFSNFRDTCRTKKKSSKMKSNFFCLCKRSYRKLDAIVTDADAQIWCDESHCNISDVESKREPCFWFFRCCPSVYSCFYKIYKFNQSMCRMFLYLITACVWCPIFCCTYICYEVVCQCILY